MSRKTPDGAYRRGFFAWGLERREVEKRIYVGKGAAHGFRNLSAIKIPGEFEQQIAELKTEFNENVNNLFDFYWKIPSSFGSNPSKIGIQSSAIAV